MNHAPSCSVLNAPGMHVTHALPWQRLTSDKHADTARNLHAARSSSSRSSARCPHAARTQVLLPTAKNGRGGWCGGRREGREGLGGENEAAVLVIRAAGVHPVPSRTRQLSPPAPMVVWGVPTQESAIANPTLSFFSFPEPPSPHTPSPPHTTPTSRLFFLTPRAQLQHTPATPGGYFLFPPPTHNTICSVAVCSFTGLGGGVLQCSALTGLCHMCRVSVC